jgi:hypothetical protein
LYNVRTKGGISGGYFLQRRKSTEFIYDKAHFPQLLRANIGTEGEAKINERILSIERGSGYRRP